MSRKIHHTFINDLLARTNLIKLIDSKLPLKKQNKNYHACCPFHNEKTPSFIVNSDKQIYHCFGCGAHGNAIDFLMNYEQMNFVETIEELASMQGIELIYEGICIERERYQRQNIYKLMDNINKFYQYALNSLEYKDNKAKQYLIKRGLNKEIINRFSIGFAPSGWDNLIKHFVKYYNSYKQLNISGMIVINNGRAYDRFRERIMFPIRDRRGRIVAFGGRVLNNTLPKYLNSPETEIFHKSDQLYGLYEATANNIEKNLNKILVVEGYMDVIALTQFGINYAVAILGTSITAKHIKLLFRITNTIICCYDGDQSGREAAWRTLEIAMPYLNETLQLKFVFLPNGEDPDSLIRKEGKKNFEQRLEKSKSFSNFLFDTVINKINLDTDNDNGKLHFNRLVIPLIKKLPTDNNILRLTLAHKLGKYIGIPDTTSIRNIIENYSPKQQYYRIPTVKPTTMRILISSLLRYPNFVSLIPDLNNLKKVDLPGLNLFLELVSFCKLNPGINTGQLLEYYRNNKFIKQIEKLAFWNNLEVDVNNPDHLSKKIFEDALKHLFNIVLDKRFESLITKERINGLTLTTEEREEVNLIAIKRVKQNN